MKGRLCHYGGAGPFCLYSMKPPTEKKRIGEPIVRLVKKRNETHTHQAFITKLHGGMYQQRGLPDYLVIYRGWPIFWEVKRTPDMTGTELQERTLANLRRSGAIAYVPSYAEDALTVLDQIDNYEDNGGPAPRLKGVRSAN